MNEKTTTEETKYIKRIDDLIEEAEIEAELEAENRIRSKNTKILGISLLGAALSLFVYIQMNDSVEFDTAVHEPAPAITEINNLGLPLNNPPQEGLLPPSIEMAALTPEKNIPKAPVTTAPIAQAAKTTALLY